jgi:hypothetical protein
MRCSLRVGVPGLAYTREAPKNQEVHSWLLRVTRAKSRSSITRHESEPYLDGSGGARHPGLCVRIAAKDGPENLPACIVYPADAKDYTMRRVLWG